MYNNVGTKIKYMAIILLVIEIIASVIVGFLMIDISEGLTFAIMIGGPLVACASYLLIYGFGELIDKVCDIERNIRGLSNGNKEQSCNREQITTDEESGCDTQIIERSDDQRIEKFKRLLSMGLVTEEEYQQVISKINKR